ncbi:EAL domain-containing protein [Hansschlegelia beijingensis]|uniref:EAL domain-containing protein n=1 Tax=Hansschlegelia beijingensis TaxID=1133344 RepID=UPI00387F23DF
MRGRSSVGRALQSHCRGQGFEPRRTRPDLEPFDPDEPEAPAEPLRRAATPDLGLLARLELALRDDRIDVHLQPVVSLPSRRILHYEALSRLIENEVVTEAAGFMDVAAAAGRLAEIDRRALERAAGVALRLAASGRTGSVFVNIAPSTLSDDAAVAAIRATLDRQSECARLVVLELRQAEFEQLDAVQRAALDGFRERGVRLSMDRTADLRLEPRELAQKGVRFVKVAAERLLDPDAVRGASIHPADLAGLLARHGIDLVATNVEEERTVPEL